MVDEQKKYKIVWITSIELQRMCDHVREYTHDCPYCGTERTYSLSNGDLYDIACSSVFIECWKCHESYHLAWEGEPEFMYDDEDFLPF